MGEGALRVLSALAGWVYTAAWSLSFYPQPLLNYRRKSTAGTTIDFPFINALGISPLAHQLLPYLTRRHEKSPSNKTGFLAYLASNCAFSYSPTVRAQYALRHNNLTPTVQPNDVFFALHALLLSLLTTSQYLLPAWSFRVTSTRPSKPILGLALGCLLGVSIVSLIVAFSAPTEDASGWCALDVAYAVSYVKLIVTLVKFTPQVIANYRNKSTRGWAIGQILLDVAGGLLSVAQQCVDSWLQRDWSGITGNPVKFALGNVSMVYDGIFMWQHYVLYRGAGERRGSGEGRVEEEGLLERRED